MKKYKIIILGREDEYSCALFNMLDTQFQEATVLYFTNTSIKNDNNIGSLLKDPNSFIIYHDYRFDKTGIDVDLILMTDNITMAEKSFLFGKIHHHLSEQQLSTRQTKNTCLPITALK